MGTEGDVVCCCPTNDVSYISSNAYVIDDGISEGGFIKCERTGFLLLHGQLAPRALHAITQAHPQLGLLGGRQQLPTLLDVDELDVGDGVGGVVAGVHGGDGATGKGRRGEGRRPDDGGAEHGCDLT